MEIQFYYADAQSQPVGPLSIEEIRKIAEAGVVPPDVMVCEAGGDDWKPLNSLEPLGSPARESRMQANVPTGLPPAAPARKTRRHVSMELTDSGKTPKALLWGCNVAWPAIIGIGAAIFFLVKILQHFGVIEN